MAPSLKHFSFLFLILFISSLQVQARDGQFFSKVTPYNNNVKEKQFSGEQEEEPSFTPETQNGYGLYGHSSNNFPPTTTNEAKFTSGNLPRKIPTSEYAGENYESKEFNTRYPYNNNDFGYQTKSQEMSDTRVLNKGYPNMNNGYPLEKQGMSDTRFLENGKYFYDTNNENYYQNGYNVPLRGSNYQVNSRNKYNYGGNYYGSNNENSYEVNESLGGYSNQEQYKESEEAYNEP